MLDLNNENIRLIYIGDINNLSSNILVRIHSSCIASEVFGSLDCDCADQLQESMKLIAQENQGIVIHLQQEGRGHGLSKKIKAVDLMQKNNIDTAESFDLLNYEYDIRDYSKAIEILKLLNINSIRLITNNPRKLEAVKNNDILINSVVNTSPIIREENEEYLYSKNLKLEHFIPLP